MLGFFFNSQQNLQKAKTDAELLQDTVDFTLINYKLILLQFIKHLYCSRS